CYHYYSGQAF
nr:immunoglobulin light chain junction region [Macaca mulatta]